jgi:hypothetical protein
MVPATGTTPPPVDNSFQLPRHDNETRIGAQIISQMLEWSIKQQHQDILKGQQDMYVDLNGFGCRETKMGEWREGGGRRKQASNIASDWNNLGEIIKVGGRERRAGACCVQVCIYFFSGCS